MFKYTMNVIFLDSIITVVELHAQFDGLSGFQCFVIEVMTYVLKSFLQVNANGDIQ